MASAQPVSAGNTRADSRSELVGQDLRWIPIVFVIGIALSGVLALLLLGADKTLESHPWLIAAGSLVSIGIGLSWHYFRRRPLNTATPASETPDAGQSMAHPTLERLTTFGTLTDYVYWEQDAQGRYTSIDTPNANPYSALRCLLGTRRGDMNGDWLEPTTTHYLDALVNRRESFHRIVWSRTLPDGATLIFEESGQARFDLTGQFVGYQGVIREISSSGMAHKPNQCLVNALAANPVPAMLLQAAPRDSRPQRTWAVQWVNPAMIALTGQSADNLQHHPLSSWLKVTDPTEDEHTPVLMQLLNSESNHRKPGAVTDRHGSPHRAVLTINKIEQTSFGTSTVIFVDHLSPALTRLERESVEIQALRESEARQTLELQVAARELESFSHTVSHDLGAPIRHVIGFSDLLREQYGGLLDRVGKNSLERISGAGHRMESMLHALVDLHRISTTPVAVDRLNLSGMARSVAQEIEQGQPDSRVTIDIQDGLVCRADRALMRMVLWNLLNNAVKFSAKSAHPQVSVRQVEQDGMSTFVVSDNGVGFDPQSADQLFRPFARLHASADYPGTGVGLATVQRIIRSHGGQIWAESEPGNGARFMFTLWENSAVIPSVPGPPAQ